MTHYARPKQPIDDKPATRWGIASCKSIGVGVGPVGASLGLYDLVNMETYRAHRMALKSAGIGKGFKAIPISGSFLNSDYAYFTTSRPANFPDFDGAAARLTEVNLGLYSWSWLTVLDGTSSLAKVKTSGGGLTIPNVGTGGGVTEILYSDGQPLETPEFEPQVELRSREDFPMKIQYAAHEDALVIKLRDDLLFDFDKYSLKPTADKPLRKAAAFIRSKTGFSRVSIEGHTDSKGSSAYNTTLSKRRARAVAHWFISRRLLNAAAVDTVGKGETDPAAPNTRPDGSDDPGGRARNRRVEIWLVKQERFRGQSRFHSKGKTRMTTTVTDANGTTHFFEVYSNEPIIVRKGPPVIALPPPEIGSAMMFVPRAVPVVERVAMVVYYHGHNGSSSIEEYIKANRFRDFRARLQSTQAVLVEPWGGHRSKFGALGTPAGLNLLTDQAMSTAIRFGRLARPVPSPPPKAPLILAGFSGGGATLKNLVIGSKANYISRLKEVWCIDCMYSGEGQAWLDWAKSSANAGRMLRVRTSTEEGTGSPRAQARLILDAYRHRGDANIDIEETTQAGHEELPSLFIEEWLATPRPTLTLSHEAQSRASARDRRPPTARAAALPATPPSADRAGGR